MSGQSGKEPPNELSRLFGEESGEERGEERGIEPGPELSSERSRSLGPLLVGTPGTLLWPLLAGVPPSLPGRLPPTYLRGKREQSLRARGRSVQPPFSRAWDTIPNVGRLGHVPAPGTVTLPEKRQPCCRRPWTCGHLYVVVDHFLTTILPWGERPGGRLPRGLCRYSAR
jgi:hypothetical protein